VNRIIRHLGDTLLLHRDDGYTAPVDLTVLGIAKATRVSQWYVRMLLQRLRVRDLVEEPQLRHIVPDDVYWALTGKGHPRRLRTWSRAPAVLALTQAGWREYMALREA
jgi:hypothetical protein